MPIISKILPSLKLITRLNGNGSFGRRYVLLQVVCQKFETHHKALCSSSAGKPVYGPNQITAGAGEEAQDDSSRNKIQESQILSIALVDLDCAELNRTLIESSRLGPQENPNCFAGSEIHKKYFIAKYPVQNQDLDVLVYTFYKLVFGVGTSPPQLLSKELVNDANTVEASPAIKNIAAPNLKWTKYMPFCAVKGSWPKNFSMISSQRSFSTNATALREKNPHDSQVSNILSKILIRKASSGCSDCTRNPDYEYHFISKLFDSENFLMRSDAYNQAIAETAKRKAALKESKSVSRNLSTDCNRPKVTNIETCGKGEDQQAVKSGKCSSDRATKGCKKDATKKSCGGQSEKLSTTQTKGNKCNKSSGSKKGDVPKNIKDNNPCTQKPQEYVPKCNTDGCKSDKRTSGNDKKHSTATKTDDRPKKTNPCKKEKQERDPCKRGGETLTHKNDPCGSKTKDPCAERNLKFSNANDNNCGKKQKYKSNKSNKSSRCTKRSKDDHSKRAKEVPCKNKQKDDPCKRGDSAKVEKVDPCKKKMEVPSKKDKPDPCKKQKQDHDEHEKGKRRDPCGKRFEKEAPCRKENKSEDPCRNKTEKPPKPCDKQDRDPCKKKKKPSDLKRTSSSSEGQKETRPNCGKNKKAFSTLAAPKSNTKRETKPNCGKIEKRFSTFAKTSTKPFPFIKINFGFMRRFSSQRSSKKAKSRKDFGKKSQCQAVGTRIPRHRKPAYNPHPKDGLRKCYQTYDMDCKKLCKDASETGCKKYAFLKDTASNKSSN